MKNSGCAELNYPVNALGVREPGADQNWKSGSVLKDLPKTLLTRHARHIHIHQYEIKGLWTGPDLLDGVNAARGYGDLVTHLFEKESGDFA